MTDSPAQIQYRELLTALEKAGSVNPEEDAQRHALLIFEERIKNIVKSYIGRLEPGLLKELIHAEKEGRELVGATGRRYSEGTEDVSGDSLPESEGGETPFEDHISSEAPKVGRGRKRKENS